MGMNAGDIIATLRLRTNEFQRNLTEAQSRLQRTSKDFKKVGAAVGAVGLGMAAGLGSCIKTAADFQQGMSRVGAVANASDTQMKELTATAKQLGATTSYSATQAAEGMQYLAMAGFEADDIIGAMPGVLDMAAAGAVDLGSAADIASNVLSGFGKDAGEAANVADVLAKTFTTSNTTLGSIGETMKYVAPAAASVGWSLEEMAAATGKLGDVGINGSMAGTALRRAIVNLASPTDKAAALMEKYKIELIDGEGKMKKLPAVLGHMKDKFKDLSDAERAAAVKTIFGTNAMSSMLALMKDPQGLEEYTEKLKKAKGTAGEIADKQLNNLHGALTLLKSAFEGLQISIGDYFIAPLTKAADFINFLVTKFNELDEGTKRFVAGFLGISTAVLLVSGGLLMFIGFIPNILGGINSVIKVAKSLGTAFSWLAANPIGLIVLAIIALVAIFVLLYKKNEAFRNKVIEIWNAIVAFMTPVIQALVAFIKEQFGKVSAWWQETMPVFLEAWSNIWSAIWAVLEPIVKMIVGIIKWAFPFILVVIQSVWNNIKNIIEGTIGAIMDIINIFSYLFTGQWGKLWESVKSLFFNVLKVLWNYFQVWGMGKMFKFLGGLLGKITGLLGRFGGNILRGVIRFFIRIASRITARCGIIRNIFAGLTRGIKTLFTSMVGAIIGSLTSLISGIKSKVTKAKNFLSELNPFKRHSPSLVDNVLAGVAKIKKTYASVGGIKVDAPQIGGLTPGRINVGSVVGVGSGGSGGETNYNAPLLQVENMHVRKDEDIRGVSSELYNLQRNADRSRGR